ncbi:MAG TPA: thioesterase family protein [Bradyrhizobium sp.]|nr:thioesterase family protein [Bradyrhizobium sp.]
MEAIFRVDGTTAVTSPHAAGPWNPNMQHGGAPASLVVWAAERIATAMPMQIARVTIDLMRPVPVAPLTIETEVLREGRKIQLCAVRLKANGVPTVAATVLKVRRQALPLPEDVVEPPLDVLSPEQSRIEPQNSPFGLGMTIRAARGRFGGVGPGAIWYRADRPLIEGAPISQAMRAVVASDFCNASSALDFRHWTFLNADLSVSMAREPVGEWILLDAVTWIGSDGAGLAMARLADTKGYFGRCTQSLVIEKR